MISAQIEEYKVVLPQLEDKNEEMITRIEQELGKQIEQKSIKEDCLQMVERQRVLQAEFKQMKSRRTQLVADIALWEERNLKLKKQVSTRVKKERKEVRKLIMCAANGKKSKASHNLSITSKSTAATSMSRNTTAFGSTWHPNNGQPMQSVTSEDAQLRSLRYVKRELQKSKDVVLEAIQMLE